MENPSLTILETGRLVLRKLTSNDAAFILDLLNQLSFIRYVGDKGVRTLEDARHFIESGPVQSYQRYGFGLYLVEEKQSATPMGICGLLKRETLEDFDLGFAFLPTYWSQGYATEAGQAVLNAAKANHGLHRVVAITNVDNHASMSVLGRLGFAFEGMMQMAEEKPEIRLFGKALV
ncbi:MAG TPA: GNAT family N-acetyltransferase [Rhodothermales bacterium]|nr:GNAT family N-acetyltransferase [Rhodothermales bacterium]